MRYWLVLFSPEGQPLEPPTEWVCDTLEDSGIEYKCCEYLRQPAVETVELYDHEPDRNSLPIAIYRKNPCKK